MSVICHLQPRIADLRHAIGRHLYATTLLVAFLLDGSLVCATGNSSHSLLLLDSIQAMSGQDMRKSPF